MPQVRLLVSMWPVARHPQVLVLGAGGQQLAGAGGGALGVQAKGKILPSLHNGLSPGCLSPSLSLRPEPYLDGSFFLAHLQTSGQ